MKQYFSTYACTVALVGLSAASASAQEVPGGTGEPAPRAPGGKLERVEILGKQASDNAENTPETANAMHALSFHGGVAPASTQRPCTRRCQSRPSRLRQVPPVAQQPPAPNA